MKTFCCFLLLVCLACFNGFSQNPTAKPDSVVHGATVNDRNMFGHHLKRGLTLTSEGLADGYILYPVTNSANMYLLNRKGEVVHQWKSTYGVLGGYLQNDGSVLCKRCRS